VCPGSVRCCPPLPDGQLRAASSYSGEHDWAHPVGGSP
jgi:hypothetical protein